MVLRSVGSSVQRVLLIPVHSGVDQIKQSCALIGRVQQHWQELVMIAGVGIAVASCAVAFFSSSLMISGSFFFLGFICAVGAYFLRQFSQLQQLEQTVDDLKKTHTTHQHLIRNLQEENNRLSTVKETLAITEKELSREIARLTLMVTQFEESSKRIKDEVLEFQQQNSHLNHNVNGLDKSLNQLDQHLHTSRRLCDQISQHLTTQQHSLAEQLLELRQFLSTLMSEDRTFETMRQLLFLKDELNRTTQELAGVQKEYAAERARFEEIGNALSLLKEEYSREFHGNIHLLQDQVDRIRQLVNTAYTLHPSPYPGKPAGIYA